MSEREPHRTLRIYGGASPTTVDTDALAITLRWLFRAAEVLTNAVRSLLAAESALDQAAHLFATEAWQPLPAFPEAAAFLTGLSPAESMAAADKYEAKLTERRLAEQARELSRQRGQLAAAVAAHAGELRQRFSRLVASFDDVSQALRRAISWYDDAESYSIKVLTQLQLLGGSSQWKAGPSSSVSQSAIVLDKATTSPWVTWLTQLAAPVSDQLVGGLANLISILPGNLKHRKSRTDASITVAARMLTAGANKFLPKQNVVTTEIFLGQGEAFGCAAPEVSWQSTPSSTVNSALTRVGDLHPFDPNSALHEAYPECSRKQLPTGTIGVEQITHPDGTTSWAVLIPGTQSFKPGVHPFDGVTDLTLMAQQPSQVETQVLAALQQAGVPEGDPVVLIGHSLGGIAAVAIASSAAFQQKHKLGAVVTAGSPTATFEAQPGVPYLHLENDEELVSNLDAKAGAGNPSSPNRVTITRRLASSSHPEDQKAASSITGAHPIETHQRTLDLALDSGSLATHEVVGRIEQLLDGETSHTRFFTARRIATPD